MKNLLPSKVRHAIEKLKINMTSYGFKVTTSSFIATLALVLMVGTFEPYWWDQAEMPEALLRKLE